MVGNDSVLDPVVDEPLAQYSACLVLRATEPGDVDALCAAHIDSGYEQMRMLGDKDGPAARATDEFASSGQYAGVVYGKAAAFYLALEDEFGAGQVADALGAVTEEHAFTMMTSDGLRDALAAELGDEQRFDRLWTRWMERAHGDRDLGVDPSSGLGDLGDLGGSSAVTAPTRASCRTCSTSSCTGSRPSRAEEFFGTSPSKQTDSHSPFGLFRVFQRHVCRSRRFHGCTRELGDETRDQQRDQERQATRHEPQPRSAGAGCQLRSAARRLRAGPLPTVRSQPPPRLSRTLGPTG